MEAFAIRINRKMAEILKANAKRKGRANPKDPKERAGNGCPNDRVNLNGLDDWTGNRCPKTRSTKVPTKSRHGFSVKTINKDISSGDNFSLVSGDEVASAGTDDKLDNKAARAALRTHPTGAVAGGRRLCRCCLLPETPRTYQDTPEALPVFTGRYNKCWRLSVSQEADAWVAVPPSLNGLVGQIVQRGVQQV